MTVTNTEKDMDALTMVVTAEFEAPPERVWQLWGDPRQLERWWGPPEYPATFVEHDLTAGGTVTYYMTGPDGEKFHGWWRVTRVDAPSTLELQDGFANDAGEPNPDMPTTTMRAELHPTEAGTRMTITSTFESREAMQQLIDMGMEEGITAALNQADAILAV